MRHSTDPFEHWIVDDFLPTEMAQAAVRDFYRGEGQWVKREHLYCHNKRTRISGLGAGTEQALAALESPSMCTYVGQLTGVLGLTSDVMRFGGGQHVTTQGGRLGIHADFTHHPTTGMRRALNLLLYLSDNESGVLELWDAQVRQCVVTVQTRFNRAVIFKTGVSSFHGHPEPLEEAERLSLAVYYYVPVTLTPGHTEYHLGTTDYRPRPWEYGLRLRRWASRLVKG